MIFKLSLEVFINTLESQVSHNNNSRVIQEGHWTKIYDTCIVS